MSKILLNEDFQWMEYDKGKSCPLDFDSSEWGYLKVERGLRPKNWHKCRVACGGAALSPYLWNVHNTNMTDFIGELEGLKHTKT